MKLSDMYRAGDVNRWQIVKTLKQQSVAEHSFQVAMIALELGHRLGLKTPHQISTMLQWALQHDLPEVFTGDIATPVKRMLTEGKGDMLVELEDLLSARYKGIRHVINEDDGQLEVKYVVKLADLIESWKFLHQNAVTDHGRKIRDKIHRRIFEYARVTEDNLLSKGRVFNPGLWTGAVQSVMDELVGPERTLDDLL